jgi:hypothetical protein
MMKKFNIEIAYKDQLFKLNNIELNAIAESIENRLVRKNRFNLLFNNEDIIELTKDESLIDEFIKQQNKLIEGFNKKFSSLFDVEILFAKNNVEVQLKNRLKSIIDNIGLNKESIKLAYTATYKYYSEETFGESSGGGAEQIIAAVTYDFYIVDDGNNHLVDDTDNFLIPFDITL